MKILELRFKNLNSLYGEWIIDFTAPEYTFNGIFALTGPTGAGKSTILDAICLALYGATPRLGKITKGGNEIMSRLTGECYAGVIFESQAGRFNVHWGQHRARKKTDGKLAEARHEISDAESGSLIETKKSLVPGIVEKKTGMDFERFTRSILLAQGGFDTFLKADTEQKSKILEQITGTGIYTEISKRVHEKQRDEREKLNLILAETSGITILDPEEENLIQKELNKKELYEKEAEKKIIGTEEAIAWLTGIEALKKDLRSLALESEKLKADNIAFKEKQNLLDRALKAAESEADYAALSAVRNEQKADNESVEIKETALPALDTAFKQRLNILKECEAATEKAGLKEKEAAPLIQKIRSLDQKLADKKKTSLQREKECRNLEQLIEDDRKLKISDLKSHDKAKKTLKQINKYLESRACDDWLVGGLAGIEEQLAAIVEKNNEVKEKSGKKEIAAESLERASSMLEKSLREQTILKNEVKTADDNLEKGKRDLIYILDKRLLREYRTEKETLLREMAFLSRISELEEYRLKLEDGKPCPLCGAKNHPFAEGNIPQPDKTEKRIEDITEIIQKAEAQKRLIKRLEDGQKDSQKKLQEAEKQEAILSGEKRMTEKNLADIIKGAEETKASLVNLKRAVDLKLQPLGFTGCSESEPHILLQSLKFRREKWLDQLKKKSETEKTLSDLENSLKRLDAVMETKGISLAEKKRELSVLKKEYDEEAANRCHLFGTKCPDKESDRLSEITAKAILFEKEARRLYDQAQKRESSAKASIQSALERIKKRKSELERLSSVFGMAIRKSGFADEKDFLESRLNHLERERLSAEASELDRRETAITARQKDRGERLSVEEARKITENSIDYLESQLKRLKEDRREAGEILIGLRHKLAGNNAAKERIKERHEAIEALKRECLRWEKLHGLIGSADGKKYRNFAQGLTFELMVSHANRQLEKMTDRYFLIRDNLHPLELNVIDSYQAGEIRSIRNLSGGESFIVSLTLALGLSKMASRRVSVDSLFLDEGFGTLDEEALETALETLSGLQQDGKLIGIISHVSALQERIGTRIEILPDTGGKSLLKGPGCSRNL